ncbi:hypothetical protein INR49_020696, partial [Caranx melampygus]
MTCSVYGTVMLSVTSGPENRPAPFPEGDTAGEGSRQTGEQAMALRWQPERPPTTTSLSHTGSGRDEPSCSHNEITRHSRMQKLSFSRLSQRSAHYRTQEEQVDSPADAIKPQKKKRRLSGGGRADEE